ncbi:hypothetical protein HUT15_36755 (plasmid) [Streptomyces sp. NA03103]|uniref:hypothetical protein n=1 Tax=Streptomyces sp. NA03103 TaxID=2742134 RepID=UPI001590B831|nr:hypothetical protein [Streptomyces sp. NA03103]QKW66081.1 hypothetical protein HUT15_36755 [Streptomyces sp. NA03103]
MAMWMCGDAVRKQAGTERIEALRGESHMTRSAVTRPLVALRGAHRGSGGARRGRRR